MRQATAIISCVFFACAGSGALVAENYVVALALWAGAVACLYIAGER